ncbi:MAG: RluA family pseudouridine synthase [Armatimonadota bacterium]
MANEPAPKPGRTIRLAIPSSLAQERLDRVLARMIPALSRSYLKKLAKEGHCFINGVRANPRDVVDVGDVVALSLTEDIEPPCRPTEGALDVRFEDEHVLVVAKPTDLVSHPAKGHHCDTLLNRIVAYLMTEIERGWSRPHLLSRLDRYTSGLILVAKTPRAQRILQRQMDRRLVRREYLALVWGRAPRRGVVDEPIGEKRGDDARMIVTEDGRPARTEFVTTRVFRLRPDQAPDGRQAAVSAMRARLSTGRTHQVRVHLASAGHTVLGDDLYGEPELDRPRDPQFATRVASLGGYALHAGVLGFVHPITEKPVRLVAAPPGPFLELLRWLHRNDPQSASGGTP